MELNLCVYRGFEVLQISNLLRKYARVGGAWASLGVGGGGAALKGARGAPLILKLKAENIFGSFGERPTI